MVLGGGSQVGGVPNYNNGGGNHFSRIEEVEGLRCIQASGVWWLNVKQAASKFLAEVVDKEQVFYFRPYSYTPKGITKAYFFEDNSGEISLVPLGFCPMRSQTTLVVVAPSLLPNKLESRESVALYNPKRVFRQLGYDQGAVIISGVRPRSAWSQMRSTLARGTIRF